LISANTTTYTEPELLLKLSKNDRDAQQYAINQFAAPLLGMIMQTVPSRYEAENLLYKVFRSIFENIPSFMGKRLRLAILLMNHCRTHIGEHHKSYDNKVKYMQDIPRNSAANLANLS
jgi:hypothetical protein